MIGAGRDGGVIGGGGGDYIEEAQFVILVKNMDGPNCSWDPRLDHTRVRSPQEGVTISRPAGTESRWSHGLQSSWISYIDSRRSFQSYGNSMVM